MHERAWTLVLAVVIACVASGLGLATTYALTVDRIEEQERIRMEESQRAVMPGAASFEPVEDDRISHVGDDRADGVVTGAWAALGEDGELIGWAVAVAPRGYGGPMQMFVGLERGGQVAGVSIVSMNETPGLGTKVADEGFLGQFEAWEAVTVDADAKTLDAVSGATKSSNGIRKGVVAAAVLHGAVLAIDSGGE